MLKNFKNMCQTIFGKKKIIQYSPPRTGSTLVYNILRELFSHCKIQKTHNYEDKFDAYPVVVTYRHPLDSIASSIQRYGRTPSDEEIRAQIREFDKTGIGDILKIRNQSNVLMLKYEEFYNRYDYIYDLLEKFFSIKIPADERKRLSDGYNMDAVKQMTQNFDDFRGYNKVTQLHGRHISEHKGETYYYKSYFSPAQIEYLKNVYKDILDAFDYK